MHTEHPHEPTEHPEEHAAPIESDVPATHDRREAPRHRVEWEHAPEARMRDVLDIAFPELTAEQRAHVCDVVCAGERIAYDALADIVPDDALRRSVAKAAAGTLRRGITGASVIERIRLFLTEQRAVANGIGLVRALRWLSANTGRTDLQVVYPASGPDASGFLNHIGAAPVARVTCITLEDIGGGKRAEEKVTAQGKRATRVLKTVADAIADGDVAPDTMDCIVLDRSGAGALMAAGSETNTLVGALDHALRPGGIIVATGDLRDLMRGLPESEYRSIGVDGGQLIVERIANTVEARA